MCRWPCRVKTLLAFLVLFSITASAAELGGIQFPNSVQAEGKTLVLNGIGQRVYSILRVPIYVAGLYLQHPSRDANAILTSSQVKLLLIKFQRDISAERARAAWRTGFDNNCVAPCHLDPDSVARFLAAIPEIRAGDVYTFLFAPDGARVYANNRPLGVIPRPQFAQAMLATFLGPRPASVPLKEALLRGHA